MKNIITAKLTKGYEHWETTFLSETVQNIRAEAGITILGYGYSEETERVYVVQEMESIEVVQKVMAENQELMKDNGVDAATIQMIALKEI